MFRIASRSFSTATFKDIRCLNPGVAFKGLGGLGRNKILIPFDKSSKQIIVEDNQKNKETIEQLYSYDSTLTSIAGVSILGFTFLTPFSIMYPHPTLTSACFMSLASLGYCIKKTSDYADTIFKCEKELEENRTTQGTIVVGKNYAELLPENWRVGTLVNINEYDWYVMDVPNTTGVNYKGVHIVAV